MVWQIRSVFLQVLLKSFVINLTNIGTLYTLICCISGDKAVSAFEFRYRYHRLDSVHYQSYPHFYSY